MTCLDKIIGVKNPCNDDVVETLSGYLINDYPGITLQTASNMADEEMLTGYKYLKDLVRRAMMRLENDMLSYINNNYRVNTIKQSVWATGVFNTPQSIIQGGTAGQQRGVYIQKKMLHCKLYKLYINSITIYSNFTGKTTLKIADVDAGVSYNPQINLVAGEVLEFVINKAISGNEARITLDSSIPVYSTKTLCGVGCVNTPISDAVRVYGIDNGNPVQLESYGIIADVLVKCDLSNLICDMASDKIIGQAAYELCGAMFYDEMTKQDRLNYLTIYKGDELKQQAMAGFDAYRNYMENSFKGLQNYLVSKDGGCKCIDCSGVKIKANI